MRKETTAMSSSSHHPTGGRRSRLERYSGTPPVAYQDGKDTKEVEGGRRIRRTRRSQEQDTKDVPSYPSPSFVSFLSLHRVVLPLSVAAGGVFTLALLFEPLVPRPFTRGVLDRSLDALTGGRCLLCHRIVAAAGVRIVRAIVIHVTHL